MGATIIIEFESLGVPAWTDVRDLLARQGFKVEMVQVFVDCVNHHVANKPKKSMDAWVGGMESNAPLGNARDSASLVQHSESILVQEKDSFHGTARLRYLLIMHH